MKNRTFIHIVENLIVLHKFSVELFVSFILLTSVINITELMSSVSSLLSVMFVVNFSHRFCVEVKKLLTHSVEVCWECDRGIRFWGILRHVTVKPAVAVQPGGPTIRLIKHLNNKFFGNWRTLLHRRRQMLHFHYPGDSVLWNYVMAAILKVQRQIENLTVNRCMYTGTTFLPNFIPKQFETTEPWAFFEEVAPTRTRWVAICDQYLI